MDAYDDNLFTKFNTKSINVKQAFKDVGKLQKLAKRSNVWCN